MERGPGNDRPRPSEARSGHEAGRPRDPKPEPTPGLEKEPKTSAWEAADRKRRTALVVRLFLGLALLVLFVIFVSLNSDEVQVHFVFTETRTPLAWVFLVCALIGGLVAYLLGRQGRRSTRKYIKELERKLEERGKRD